MTETADPSQPPDEAPAKGGKGGIIIALAGALIAGGGGFYATYSGLLSGVGKGAKGDYSAMSYSFVALEPIIISLGASARAETLKFRAELEVDPSDAASVEGLAPRIIDVLQDYLRAVDEAELEDPRSLSLLRAQMLRRIQTVVGDGKVRDLLIMEFILS